MPRTSDSLVGEIITTGLDDLGNKIPLAGFIQAANVLTSRVVNCASAKGVPLTAEEARVLETLLAAHFYAHRDQLYTSKSTMDASASFQGQFGMGLKSTQYGQTALSLDPSGCLSAIDARIGVRPTLTWLGKAPSEQIDYVDRD